MPVQNMHGDVGPEFTKDIRESITAEGISVFRCDLSGGAVFAGIIGDRDGLRQASAQQLRNVETFAASVGRSDEDAGSRPHAALQKSTLAERVVAFILMKNRW